MDFRVWIFMNVAMLLISFISSGVAQSLWNDDDDETLADDTPVLERREPEYLNFNFEPDDDSLRAADGLLINLLKRRGFYLPESYRRISRIKSRVIIPFYNYGMDKSYYGSRPRIHSLQSSQRYGPSPWNMDRNRHRDRFRSKGYSVY